jgi:DNA-directed RNA polymerase specialized sigma24 family protein
MSNGYVVSIDPNDFSRFVSFDPRDEGDEDDGDMLLDEDSEEIEEMRCLLEKQGYRVQLQPLLERIPEREADIIELYFLMGKRQADIAIIFGMTQAAVSYRLARGIKRIKFLLEIPEVTLEQMKADLSEIFVSRPGSERGAGASKTLDGVHIDVMILLHMWQTTCQSVVAQQLSLTQGRVRHRFFKAVEKLKEAAAVNPKFEPYSEIFSKISAKNFNILKEVQLPQWSKRGGDELT